jgi:hypothetical protein
MGEPLERARLAARARRLWDGDPAAARAFLQEALDGRPAARPSPDFLLELAAAQMALGDAVGALVPLERAVAGEPAGWRPRARHLQALLWAGRLESAARAATRYARQLGPGADHPLLRRLAAQCLQPTPPGWPAGHVAAGGRTVRFSVRDLGFTSVAVVLPGRPADQRLPLRFRAGSWEGDLAFPPRTRRYLLEVEGGLRVLDPEAAGVEFVAGEAWSLVREP